VLRLAVSHTGWLSSRGPIGALLPFEFSKAAGNELKR